MSNSKLIVSCPTCKTPTEWEKHNEFRPFCSKRCKIIDLGAWADENYAIEEKKEFF